MVFSLISFVIIIFWLLVPQCSSCFGWQQQTGRLMLPWSQLLCLSSPTKNTLHVLHAACHNMLFLHLALNKEINVSIFPFCTNGERSDMCANGHQSHSDFWKLPTVQLHKEKAKCFSKDLLLSFCFVIVFPAVGSSLRQLYLTAAQIQCFTYVL